MSKNAMIQTSSKNQIKRAYAISCKSLYLHNSKHCPLQGTKFLSAYSIYSLRAPEDPLEAASTSLLKFLLG